MNEKTDSWEDFRLFLAVARTGGLSPAGRLTGKSAATLGRRMLALERSTGRELFVRHERGYELTAQGRELLAELTPIESGILRLEKRPQQIDRPLVKVSAGTWTTMALLARLDDLSGEPADVRLRFVSAEALLDISRREVVIGIRNERPTDTALAGRKLTRIEFAPYATDPDTKGWIKVAAQTASAGWVSKTIGNDAYCEVSAPRNSLDLALNGKGIAVLPTFIGDTQLTLQRVGETIPELSHDQWIVTHQDDRHFPEVRRVIDRMCNVLQP